MVFRTQHTMLGKSALRNQLPSPTGCPAGRSTAGNMLSDGLLIVNFIPGEGTQMLSSHHANSFHNFLSQASTLMTPQELRDSSKKLALLSLKTGVGEIRSLWGNGRTTSCATSAGPWLISISISDTQPRDNLPLHQAGLGAAALLSQHQGEYYHQCQSRQWDFEPGPRKELRYIREYTPCSLNCSGSITDLERTPTQQEQKA